jgi:tetratricopeptide (TPR) repeat protein
MTGQRSPLAHPISQQTPQQNRYLIGIVLVVTAMTYLGTVRFGFVYDDRSQILSNPFIQSWNYLPHYFVSSLWDNLLPLGARNYYRPLFTLWMRVNYALFASRPLGWHIASVLLHLLVTWLVYRVVGRMSRRPSLAWLTALIFGVHPMHHEVVAWVSGSTESLFAAFFLAAFLAYLHSWEGYRTLWMTLSCGFYALALLSKETAIVLPVLVFIHCWIAGRPETVPESSEYARRFRHAVASIAAYVPVALIYLVLRHKVLSGFSHPVAQGPASAWLLTMPSIMFFYVKQWFFPIRLSEFYPLFYQVRLGLVHVILPTLTVLAMASAVWIFRGRLGSRDAGYAAAWIVIPLLPALDIFVFQADELVHDRYFYVPSLGAALLIAMLIEPIGRTGAGVYGQPLRLVVAALVLTVVLAMDTVHETSFWADDRALFSRAHEIAPQNASAQINLGLALIERGEIKQGQAMLEKVLQDRPDDWHSAFNLGRLQYSRKQYAKAKEYARLAIALNPGFPDSYVLLCQIQLKENRPGEALNSARRAVELNPYMPQFHTIYGFVLEVNGDCPGAITQFKAAEALAPGDFIAQRESSRCGSAAIPGSTSGTQPAQH